MEGERCEICGILDSNGNPIVIDDGIFVCLGCIYDLELEELDELEGRDEYT